MDADYIERSSYFGKLAAKQSFLALDLAEFLIQRRCSEISSKPGNISYFSFNY